MPVPGADLAAGAGAPDPMGADPGIGGGIGNMADDPNAGMPAEDPGMEGGDMGMDAGEEGGDFSSKYNELSKEDQVAVDHYMDSLLRRDETQDGGEEMPGMEEPGTAPDQAGQGVMMEITKGRLIKAQKMLQEKLRNQNNEKDEADRKQKRVKNPVGKKSPFDSPLD